MALRFYSVFCLSETMVLQNLCIFWLSLFPFSRVFCWFFVFFVSVVSLISTVFKILYPSLRGKIAYQHTGTRVLSERNNILIQKDFGNWVWFLFPLFKREWKPKEDFFVLYFYTADITWGTFAVFFSVVLLSSNTYIERYLFCCIGKRFLRDIPLSHSSSCTFFFRVYDNPYIIIILSDCIHYCLIFIVALSSWSLECNYNRPYMKTGDSIICKWCDIATDLFYVFKSFFQ